MRLEPNTILGLIWGLQNFDGIEFDLRMTQDRKMLIHHNPLTIKGENISEFPINHFVDSGIPSFKQFLETETIRELADSGKSLWIELKTNCDGKRVIHDNAEQIHSAFVKELKDSNFPGIGIHIISFSKHLLIPFTESKVFPAYRLLPTLNECNPSFVLLKNFPKFLFRSLSSHIQEAQKIGLKGLLFARQYLLGLLSKRHLSYKKMEQLIDAGTIELGTNLGSIEFEQSYAKLHRFTDDMSVYPRYSSSDNSHIIAHRGVSTKGINI